MGSMNTSAKRSAGYATAVIFGLAAIVGLIACTIKLFQSLPSWGQGALACGGMTIFIWCVVFFACYDDEGETT